MRNQFNERRTVGRLVSFEMRIFFPGKLNSIIPAKMVRIPWPGRKSIATPATIKTDPIAFRRSRDNNEGLCLGLFLCFDSRSRKYRLSSLQISHGIKKIERSRVTTESTVSHAVACNTNCVEKILVILIESVQLPALVCLHGLKGLNGNLYSWFQAFSGDSGGGHLG